MDAREARTLGVTALLAVGVPVGATAWVGARTEELAGRLAQLAGVPARIGAIDATLTGTIRLDDVALGELFAADAIEGSVGMSSLLAGELRADEIRVAHPALAIEIDPDGDSDLARLARRLANGRAAAGPEQAVPRLRRIVVTDGQLTARIAGVGELAAEHVELVPDTGGARIVTGPVRVVAGGGPLPGGAAAVTLELAFTRGAAELALPEARFGRALAVGGTGSVRIGPSEPIAVRELAAARRGAGALEIRGSIDDAGVSRAIAAEVTARGLTVTGERVPLGSLADAARPLGVDLGDTRATGSLAIRDAGQLELAIDGTLEGLVVEHSAVAATRVELSPRIAGELTITDEAIVLASGQVAEGAIQLAASGWLRRTASAGQLDLQLGEAGCQDLLAAVPERVRGPLDGMALTGRVAARARLAIDLAAAAGDGVQLGGELVGGCVVLAEPPAADVRRLAEPGTQRLADGTRIGGAREGKGDPAWTRLRRLPAHVIGAFVSAEDGRFFAHAGFDLHQIARSLEIDLRERRLARGGSTISQQLIKNAFLTQRRSLDRKLQEAILTWRLEQRLTKKQILERYLNIIELGPRIFGLDAAARYWFGVAPDELSVRQAAFLAALTSQPTSMTRRVRKASGLDPDSAERVATILRAMRRDGVIDADTLAEARSAPLRFAPSAVPER
jgi:hypothetical protein